MNMKRVERSGLKGKVLIANDKDLGKNPSRHGV